jgi:outer membrane protein assembly factor BamB
MQAMPTSGKRVHRRVVLLSPPAVHQGFACCGCAIILLIWLTVASVARGSSLIALPDMPFLIPLSLPVNITTQLYNNARQGANVNETILNPENVSGPHFGKLNQKKVDGQVLSQPLYVSDVDVAGLGRRNLLIVATAANKVYAFDADTLDNLFQAQLSLVQPAPDLPIPVDQSQGNAEGTLCAETYPEYVGVTSTPVVDTATDTLFVESFDPAGSGAQVLYALSLKDQFHSQQQVIIQPTLERPDTKWAQHERNRAGLLLSRGVVYVAFASFICDHPQPYAGWVLGFRASDLGLVAQWRTPNSTNDSGSSGIWQSGRGLVASADGAIYLMTGNDNNLAKLVDHTHERDPFRDPHLSNSFVKLTPGGTNGLTLSGWFSLKNTAQLSSGDTDLGSSGPILLPGDRIVGGGKQGRVYVIDAATMLSLQNHLGIGDDGFEGFQAFINQLHRDSNQKSCFDPAVAKQFATKFPDGVRNPDAWCRNFHPGLNALTPDACPYAMVMNAGNNNPRPDPGCYLPTSCYQYCQAYGPNIHAGFVFWQRDSSWGLLYAMPEKEYVEAFRYDIGAGKVEEVPLATSKADAPGKQTVRVPDGMPGGALSISANGNQDGIVWVSMPNQEDATMGAHRGSLVALDARDLHKLWSDDCIFYFAKFNPPIVAKGRVYLATFADPYSVTKPGHVDASGVCTGSDLNVADNLNPDPNVGDRASRLRVGTAWIISYGLR